MELAKQAKRWREVMSNGDVGPLIIAREVVAIANAWETYRAEADGVSSAEWLAVVFGRGRDLKWFERRDRAVRELGEHVRRALHHDVACYVLDNVPKSKQRGAVSALTREALRRGKGTALVLGMVAAKRVLKKEIGHVPNPVESACAACAAKDAEIAALKAQLSMREAAE